MVRGPRRLSSRCYVPPGRSASWPCVKSPQVKIRHAQSGILLSADEDSVCNSNAFVGSDPAWSSESRRRRCRGGDIRGDESYLRRFTVWGGIDEYGLKAEGPGPCNMNTFYACEIEPSATELAHVYVTGSKTNVRAAAPKSSRLGNLRPSPPPRNIHVMAAAPPRPASAGDCHRTTDRPRRYACSTSVLKARPCLSSTSRWSSSTTRRTAT